MDDEAVIKDFVAALPEELGDMAREWIRLALDGRADAVAAALREDAAGMIDALQRAARDVEEELR